MTEGTGVLTAGASLPERVAATNGGIEVIDLWKSFGPVAALRGVDLTVGPRERLAIVGPNGSGKSTLVRVLGTMLRPSAGTARVAGFDIQRQTLEARQQIGVVCHDTFLYGELTALENLDFYARLYKLDNPRERAQEQLRLVGMEAQAHVLERALSRGMQQRLALARALIHEPLVLLLDELDTGLDQQWAAFLVDLLSQAADQGRSVLLTTHNLERSLDLSDRLAVLDRGRIVYTGKRDELDVGSLKEVYSRHTGAAC